MLLSMWLKESSRTLTICIFQQLPLRRLAVDRAVPTSQCILCHNFQNEHQDLKKQIESLNSSEIFLLTL